ncbi:MAG TPA: c(7)-type cytochrome triheme domain-containing protein [Anaeromyxobacteraceae bacterium]|jgi:c(7)-type cytochrome triheme protein|nr:c(7)-type cytochrome triheme domain-containing protein [Anaeromyxobacteraceae bacterium]
MRRPIALAVLVLFAATAARGQQGPAKKRRPLPYEFGRVVIANHSEKAGLAPVVFEHWLHRTKYTCRVCHVDVGFAMKAGGTNVRATDNANGFYCGACHGKKLASESRPVFEACSKAGAADRRTCVRCHSLGMNVRPERGFDEVTRGLPKGRFGNGVDWEKAEEEHLIHPSDQLEGVSIPRTSFSAQRDFALSPKLAGLPEIIFSHKKHTVWNGCELCHPEIFVGVKRGATKYSMVEIFEGRYCGACHLTVAFPLLDCQRCHTRPVQ